MQRTRTRRAVKVLATTVIAGTLLSQEAAAQMTTVVIVGTKNADYNCCYQTTGFDGYMSQFFTPDKVTISDAGYSKPEAEAWAYSYGTWVTSPNGLPIVAHIAFQGCSVTMNSPEPLRTLAYNAISTMYPIDRLEVARAMIKQILPFYMNINKEGMVVKINYTDGGSEWYRYTAITNWWDIRGSLTPGTGIPRSACW